ncbi:MAG: penicillin-binding protein 2 [Bacteroides sp.]|nr:penicillin-binding protein 2 [Bacteroides sp.]
MLLNQGSNLHSKRKNIILAAMILTGLIFLLRLFYIQVLDPSYKLSANSNVLRYVTDYPARGLIYDRNGELLVYNEAHYDLMVVPGQVKEIDTTAFCQLLGIERVTFEERLKKASDYSLFRPSVFENQISKNTFAIFQEKLFRFPGFFVQPRTLRKYTYPIAAHTFGYVGEVGPRDIEANPYYQSGDYIGISGIERSYEQELRGQKGVKVRMVDVLNRDIGSFQEGRFDTIAIPGKDLYTTLDGQLQQYGEKLMQNKRGSIVAIEPSTGEILALVSTPSYDPNLLVGRVRNENYRKLQEDTLKPLFNRALMAQYPPGSAFKIVNTLTALQEGVINYNTQYGCGGAYYSGRIRVACHSHASPVNAHRGIQFSCNTFSCITFRQILDQPRFSNIQEGFNTWRKYVTSFGFGQPFGSDLAHELSGLIPSSEYYDKIYGPRGWRSLTVISLAIGQGEVGTTPVQLANLVATMANRGYYYTPHIVRAIAHPDSLQERFLEKHNTLIDQAHFEEIAEAMRDVVSAGTGQFSMIPGISMGGKTGTVQNPHGENHSVFIAFAPVEDPKIAISVVVENAGYGATWAAPIASLMIEKYLTRQIGRAWFEQRILEASF